MTERNPNKVSAEIRGMTDKKSPPNGKPATKATKAVKKAPAKKPANKTPARKTAR